MPEDKDPVSPRREATERHLRQTLQKRAQRLLALLQHRGPKFVVAAEALLIYEAAAALCPEAAAAMLSRRAWTALSLCGVCGLMPVQSLEDATGLCEACVAEEQRREREAAAEFGPDEGM